MSNETLERRIQDAVSASGRLFQPHPDYGAWKTTRPGGETGEVVAFTNKDCNPPFDRLSLCYFDAGEVDDTYLYQTKTWVIRTEDRAEFLTVGESFTSREAAIERLADIMIEVVEKRE